LIELHPIPQKPGPRTAEYRNREAQSPRMGMTFATDHPSVR
jgi:hypothetical protein